MKPLSDGVYQAAKWLKSSVERLSEKGYEQRSKRGFGRYREAKMGQKVPVSVALGHAVGYSDPFRTVSEGEFSEGRT